MTRAAPPTRTASSSWPTGAWSANWRARPPIRSWSGCGPWEPDMRNVTIKGLLAHKLRLMLTALAIVLGVTFISGTFVLTDTLHNTFSVLFGSVYQKIDFQVRGVAQLGSGASATRNELPESLLATVRRVPGVEAAEGGVEGYAQFVAQDGKPIQTGGAPTISVTYDSDPQLATLHLIAGGPPVTSDDVVMDAGTA